MAFFLEQCLNSVYKSIKNLTVEIFVVDNNSIDTSVKMVESKFPAVKLIANQENVGFSRANNQAIALANGKYILLLNPDTVLEEDTLTKTKNQMDNNLKIGSLGVRMLDGKGRFLPESKRGLPTPIVAFYKVFGLSNLFPKSKKFAKYHLGYLSEFNNHTVDVLCGAFMLIRKSVLDEIGLLDETFFMYGEDIDLSYRIQKAGFENQYFSETQIIHYKGESTKKSSINYVFVFYNAMIIFAKKHFSQQNAKIFTFLINVAIYFRASVAILNRFIKKALLPFMDSIIVLSILLILSKYWEINHIKFEIKVLKILLPTYIGIWMLSIYYLGGYDKNLKIKNYLLGGILGTLTILCVYALLPKDLQFSRLFILLGGILTTLYYPFSRTIYAKIKGNKNPFLIQVSKKIGIIGDSTEIERANFILNKIYPSNETTYFISPYDDSSSEYIGTIKQLDQIVEHFNIEELIFCAKNIKANEIISWMSILGSKPIEFKIAQPDTDFLIGSNSIHTSGEAYILNSYEITKENKKRFKRSLDLLLSSFILLLSPILLFFFEQKTNLFKNMFGCILGNKTLVGYSLNSNKINLPNLKNGILSPVKTNNNLDNNKIEKINLIYARDYRISMDLEIISKRWRELDRSN